MRERVQARVSLEQVAYDARTKSRSDEYKAVMSEEDQKTVDEAASEVISWLDDNSEATKEELEAKLAELQGRVKEPLEAQGQGRRAPGGLVVGRRRRGHGVG